MKRITVNIRETHDFKETTRLVQGWQSDVPGIAITPWDGRGPDWQVTHAPSGLLMMSHSIWFRTRDMANRYALVLGEYADFTQPADMVNAELKAKTSAYEMNMAAKAIAGV